MRKATLPRALLLALPMTLLGTAGAAYKSSCAQLSQFGLGELGSRPAWALADCSDNALSAERNTAAELLNVLFIQSYSAKLAAFGGKNVALDIQARMKKAGFLPLASSTLNGVVKTSYVNTFKKTSYTVLLRIPGDPKAPAHLQLVKTELK